MKFASCYIGYRLDPMEVIMNKNRQDISHDHTTVVAKDIETVKQMLDEAIHVPTFLRMTQQLTVSELTIIQEYNNFVDWALRYQDVAQQPFQQAWWKGSRDMVGVPESSSIITVAGDAIHEEMSVQCINAKQLDDIYQRMRSIALDRGELLVEYNQSMKRYPNTLGLTEWYKAIAAADPSKEYVLFEGYYVEDYIRALKAQSEILPNYTPNFMKVYMAIQAAANMLTDSIDDKKSPLFARVTQYGTEKLQESYKKWCAQFEPTVHLGRILDKLPTEYHQTVTTAYEEKFKETFAQNPAWNDTKCSAETMYAVIKTLDEKISDDFAHNKISYGGHIPTPLDMHCFNETRKDCNFERAKMSAAEWYGEDMYQHEQDEVDIEEV